MPIIFVTPAFRHDQRSDCEQLKVNTDLVKAYEAVEAGGIGKTLLRMTNARKVYVQETIAQIQKMLVSPSK